MNSGLSDLSNSQKILLYSAITAVISSRFMSLPFS